MEWMRSLTIMVVPDGSDETRSIHLSLKRLRLLFVIGLVGMVLFTLLMGSWVYFAVRAAQARQLEEQVAQLLEREEQVEDLVQTLAEIETAYERIRALFGTGAAGSEASVTWLPPAGGAAASGATAEGAEDLPSSWPLTQTGFVTQRLLADSGADHPGIDIAVPAGSYIRAAGGGVVAEVGEDPIYGYYVVLDHADGYRSLYAHASLLLAAEGDRVERHEVIALTGSSGRSTAPHLHFEIHLDGHPIDPLSMVTQP